MSFVHVATAAHIDPSRVQPGCPVLFLRPFDLKLVEEILAIYPSVKEDPLLVVDRMFVRLPYISPKPLADNRRFLRHLQAETDCVLFEEIGGHHLFKCFVQEHW